MPHLGAGYLKDDISSFADGRKKKPSCNRMGKERNIPSGKRLAIARSRPEESRKFEQNYGWQWTMSHTTPHAD